MHTALQMYAFFVKSITLNIKPRSFILYAVSAAKLAPVNRFFQTLADKNEKVCRNIKKVLRL